MTTKKKVSGWLRRKVREWLGLDPSFIAVDLGINERSVIVVATHSEQGDRVKIIPVQIDSLRDFDRILEEIHIRYGVSKRVMFFDAPRGIKR